MVDASEAMYPNGPSASLGNDPVGDDNYRTALNEMNLTPQEQFLYKMHLDNLKGKGGVDNPDGSRSTLFQSTVEFDGKHYSIPTVWDGKKLDIDAAIDRAKKVGLDKFPSYNSADDAEARYQQMHGYMEKDTAKYMQNRRR